MISLRLIELGHCSDGHSSQFRAYALINKATVVLTKLGRQEDARTALDVALAGPEADDPVMADLIAEARAMREALL